VLLDIGDLEEIVLLRSAQQEHGAPAVLPVLGVGGAHLDGFGSLAAGRRRHERQRATESEKSARVSHDFTSDENAW
jgi:hypothetical protein